MKYINFDKVNINWLQGSGYFDSRLTSNTGFRIPRFSESKVYYDVIFFDYNFCSEARTLRILFGNLK